MKTVIFVFLTLMLSSDSDSLFNDNIMVHDINGSEFNLIDLETTKDTVMVIVWCKTCGSCIKRLNSFKNIKTRQVLAIATTHTDNIDTEKSIIAKNNWTFDVFFDTKQEFVKYLIKKKYLTRYKKAGDNYQFGYPQIYMFVKNKFICKSCDNYLPKINWNKKKK